MKRRDLGFKKFGRQKVNDMIECDGGEWVKRSEVLAKIIQVTSATFDQIVEMGFQYDEVKKAMYSTQLGCIPNEE